MTKSAILDAVESLLANFGRLGKEAAWVLSGQAVTFLGGFVAIKVLTTQLGAERYGEFALGLTISGLLGLVCYGPISNVVFRFYSVSRDRMELPVFIALIRRYHTRIGVSLALSAVFTSAIGLWVGYTDWGKILAAGALFGIASGINVSLIALQNAMRLRRTTALHQAADIWLRIVLATAVLYYLPSAGSATVLLVFALGTLIVVVSQLVALAKSSLHKQQAVSLDPALVISRSREFRAYASPFVLWSGIAFISLYGDRWILQYLFGEREVGIYAAIFQIAAAPLNLFGGLVSQFATPIIYERASSLKNESQVSDSMSLLKRVLLPTTVALIVIVAGLSIFSKELVLLLTSGTFVSRHSLLFPLALGVGLFNIAQILTIKGMALNRPQVYLWPKVFQNLTFFAAAVFCGIQFGPLGVAVAYVASSFIHLVLVVQANRTINIDTVLTQKQ